MFGSLYGKLIAVLVAFALIMVAVFVLIMSYSATARRQEVSQRVYRNYASQLVKERVFPDGHLDPSAFEQVFDYLRVVNPRFDAYLIDANGTILAASSKAGALKRKSVDMRPIRGFLADDAAQPLLGDDPADARIRRVFTATRLSLEPPYGEAYLYLVIKGIRGDSTAQPILDSYVLRENVMLVGGSLALALLASALIIALLTRRLQRLARVMDRFRETGFAEQPAGGGPRAERGDEIDRLAGTFNAMADRILAQMHELRQTDSMRRELVANISHDLRTPLASLRGHLETLQFKGERLTEAEKRGYLEIALRQSEQLSHLVAGLFELAKLDSDRPAVLTEPFVLTDLVQDILQQFELSASQKQIRIAAELPLEMPLVVGDIGLIERALRNLIENSLRYTPADGEITVAVAAGQAHATVQVADTGCGIDAADLPRIFDRFYRGEKSRSDASGSAGLGLAIAKRILELHDSALTVASEPGRTTIGFTLAYADRWDVSSGQGIRSRPDAAGSATAGPAAGPAALKPLGGLGSS